MFHLYRLLAPRARAVAVPVKSFTVVRKGIVRKTFLEQVLGKESELKMRLYRYVPSQGWTSLDNIYKNLDPSITRVVTESSLRELMRAIRGCRVENGMVCRVDWIESNPDDVAKIASEKARVFQNDEELAETMLAYIPRAFVPLRAVARQVPIDIFPALRDSRFLFLLRHPEKFEVSHCVDDNCLVVRNITEGKPCTVKYEQFRLLRSTLIAAALAIPSQNPLSETDCLHRCPKTYRRRLNNAGFSFTTQASLFPKIFDLEREDEISCATSILSKLSDPEKSHPDNPKITTKIISKILLHAKGKFEKLMDVPEFSIFRKIGSQDDFLQASLSIREGNAALRHAKRIGAVRDDFIQNEILNILPQKPESVEYDVVLLKLSPKVRRQLAYEDGGLRKFLQDRPTIFYVEETSLYTRISRAAEPKQESKPKTDDKSSCKDDLDAPATENTENLGTDDDEIVDQSKVGHEIDTVDESEHILSMDDIKNMKCPAINRAAKDPKIDHKQRDDEIDPEFYLVKEVARYVPVMGVSGIAIRDLALQIGKENRKQIRADGFKTFNEFIEEYPDWFTLSGEGDDLYVNLCPESDSDELGEGAIENECTAESEQKLVEPAVPFSAH